MIYLERVFFVFYSILELENSELHDYELRYEKCHLTFFFFLLYNEFEIVNWKE